MNAKGSEPTQELTDPLEVLRRIAASDGLMGGLYTEGWGFVHSEPLTNENIKAFVAFWADPKHQGKAYQGAKDPNQVSPAVVEELREKGLIKNVACHWNMQHYVLTEAGKALIGETVAQH